MSAAPATGEPATADPGTGDPGTGDPGTGDPGDAARLLRPRLLVTQPMPPAVTARLQRDYAATLHTGHDVLSPEALLEGARGQDGLLVFPGDRLDAAALAALDPQVRIIATFSVGTDHIDLDAARARRLTVTNTPDVVAVATAEIALLLMLAVARRAVEGLDRLRGGHWPGLRPTWLLGRELAGKTLGIVGLGAIGRAVATRAQAFGLEILYHNRSPVDPAVMPAARYCARLEDLLAASDIVSLHCPLTPQTHHLIAGPRLAAMRPGAILINTARGPVIDEAAVIAAVRAGQLGGVGLDVYAGEPALNPDWLTLPQVVTLPHLGTGTVETRTAMGLRALDNLDAYFRGDCPPDAV